MSQSLTFLKKEAARFPMLEAEEEYELGVRCRDHKDEKAATKLINSHIMLVYKTANLYRNYGIPMDDIIGEGLVGLTKAVRTFNPDMGARFGTYARMWVKAEIREYIFRSWSLVRMGSKHQKKMFYRLRQIRANMGISRRFTDEEVLDISEKENVPIGVIRETESRLSGGDVFLNAPVASTDGQTEAIDLLVDDRPGQEIVMVDTDLRTKKIGAIQDAMVSVLSERERIVLNNRFTDDYCTQQELANMLSVSRQRIESMEKTALRKVKDFVGQHHRELVEA